MLTDPEVQVAAGAVVRLEVSGSLEGEARLVGRAQDRRSRRSATERAAAIDVEHLLPLVSRPAAPFGSAGYLGRSASQSSGSWRRLHLVQLLGELRVFLAVRGEQLIPCRSAARRPRLPEVGEVLRPCPGRGSSRPRASRSTASRRGPPRHPRAHRGRSGCPALWGRRSR